MKVESNRNTDRVRCCNDEREEGRKDEPRVPGAPGRLAVGTGAKRGQVGGGSCEKWIVESE